MNETLGLVALGGALPVAWYALASAKTRLELSLAKHRSLAGHPRMARRIAALMPEYRYREDEAFGIDRKSTRLNSSHT